ncbi:hypothetical protein GOP47_0001323 [Adiantum capillus-veneris]|uniref:SMP domain-containing protein n=1 Tax=Adiantum capillus-veneris TaxID=13818 RepID=A0A9D4ZQL9_ADICA|nr:hypothetical protein GOP47_0001323 [Adiantum capillus-veneris]
MASQQQRAPASTEAFVPKPNASNQAVGQDQPKTIGDALEDAARKAHDKPLEVKDARAIQSAEAHATGIGPGIAGGPAAYAQHLLDTQQQATLGDALQGAKSYLPADKVVTPRDVSGVTRTEARNHPVGTPALSAGGVAASVQAAGQYNVNKGFVAGSRAGQNAGGVGGNNSNAPAGTGGNTISPA